MRKSDVQKPDVIITRRELDNALEAHDILEIIVNKLDDTSRAATIEIETELVLRIRLCTAFRLRILKLQKAEDDSRD